MYVAYVVTEEAKESSFMSQVSQVLNYLIHSNAGLLLHYKRSFPYNSQEANEENKQCM